MSEKYIESDKLDFKEIINWIEIIGVIIIYFVISIKLNAWAYSWLLLFSLVQRNDNTMKYTLTVSEDEQEQLNLIDKMNGKDFEIFIGSLLSRNGYKNVTITRTSGDHGADILAEYNGTKYAFQCKRFDNKVSSRPIGEILRGMNYYKCEKGIVITNNYFTKQAIEEAKINNVELWDRKKVVDLCKSYINSKSSDTNSYKYRKCKTKVSLVALFFFSILVFIIYLISNFSNMINNDIY